MTLTPHERYQHKPFIGSSHEWTFSHLTNPDSELKVLDVGPGSGFLGDYLTKHDLNQLYAVELDKNAREFLSPLYIKITESIDELNETGFDLVFLLDVLEHMTNPEEFFQKIVASLNPGGKIFISVPNIAHWSIRLTLLFGIFNYTERGLLDKTHYQFFNRKRLLNLISPYPELRFQDLSASIEPIELLLPKWSWNNKIFEATSRVRLSVANTIPRLMAYQHLALITKGK